MILQATENTVAGHIWPAGCYFPTPALNKQKMLVNRVHDTVVGKCRVSMCCMQRK